MLYGTVTEFFPDGSLRKGWDLKQMLDNSRIAYDSLNSGPGGLAWTWSNAVNINALADDSSHASRYGTRMR